MKVCFETFGCRLNKAEALELEADYLSKGWERTETHKDADLFIVSGCSVTKRAQHECEKVIEHLKKHYPNKRILVRGCLKTKEQQPEAPNPDHFIVPTRTARAYLKVQDGCSGQCTFCIVPKFRGTSVSVPFQTVLDRAKQFIDAGYHEIVVTGCNLSLFASEGKRMPELLAALADLSPDCRIRLGSLEPGETALSTVAVMSERENICNFLHIPVQSGSQHVLAAMRRPYFIRDIETLVAQIYKLMPNCYLGCDLIAGYPTETELDHDATKGMLKRLPFNAAHIFPYSERPGTIAASSTFQVSHEVRHKRAHELSAIIDVKHRLFAKKFIGKVVEILSEKEDSIGGWTPEYLWCEVQKNPHESSQRKSLLKVRILDAHHGKLKGVLV